MVVAIPHSSSCHCHVISNYRYWKRILTKMLGNFQNKFRVSSAYFKGIENRWKSFIKLYIYHSTNDSHHLSFPCCCRFSLCLSSIVSCKLSRLIIFYNPFSICSASIYGLKVGHLVSNSRLANAQLFAWPKRLW